MIGDHACLGDCRTAALVDADGSVDWLCLPRFDSPSVLNRLLDPVRGGSFRVSVAGGRAAGRRYEGGAPVLVTDWEAPSGRARVTDLMPAVGERRRRARLWPVSSVLRVVEGLEGECEVSVSFAPCPQDGVSRPRLSRRGPRALVCEAGGGALSLTSDLSLETGAAGAGRRFPLRAGDRRVFWLAYSEAEPASLPAPQDAGEALAWTLEWWREWLDRGSWPDGAAGARLRASALALKLLSYAPSGAIVAAPTTSLPEALGAGRNWDYRYCWLRDAAFSASAYLKLGYQAEAEAFVHWMTSATTLTQPRLEVFYDLYGRRPAAEREVPTLSGYALSGPVRAGNGARDQFQLDVYGEVLEALGAYADAGGRLDRDLRRFVAEAADHVLTRWDLPDHGIWEARRARRHHTHSKAMCWVALAQAARLLRGAVPAERTRRWEQGARAVEAALAGEGPFTQVLGGKSLDAACLLLPCSGFDGARAAATVEAVRRGLGEGGLVRRYAVEDGLPGREGAFVACSFWLARALLRVGRPDAAALAFAAGETCANDLGLYSEEFDPRTGTMLGNFPQALSHHAHLMAGLELSAAGLL